MSCVIHIFPLRVLPTEIGKNLQPSRWGNPNPDIPAWMQLSQANMQPCRTCGFPDLELMDHLAGYP